MARRLKTVAELAQKDGVHPSTKRRQLHALERAARRRGVRFVVVQRLDPLNPRSKIVVSEAALQALNPHEREERELDRDLIAVLRRNDAEQQKELKALK